MGDAQRTWPFVSHPHAPQLFCTSPADCLLSFFCLLWFIQRERKEDGQTKCTANDSFFLLPKESVCVVNNKEVHMATGRTNWRFNAPLGRLFLFYYSASCLTVIARGLVTLSKTRRQMKGNVQRTAGCCAIFQWKRNWCRPHHDNSIIIATLEAKSNNWIRTPRFHCQRPLSCCPNANSFLTRRCTWVLRLVTSSYTPTVSM